MAYFPFHLVQGLCVYSPGRQPERDLAHIQEPDHRLFFSGLWHEGSWNFIVWSLYYVLFLIFERMGGHVILDRLPRFLQHVYSLLIIMVGWAFFRAEDLENALHYLVSMFTASDGAWTDLYIHLNP